MRLLVKKKKRFHYLYGSSRTVVWVFLFGILPVFRYSRNSNASYGASTEMLPMADLKKFSSLRRETMTQSDRLPGS